MGHPVVLLSQDFGTPIVDMTLDPFRLSRVVLASNAASIFVIDDATEKRDVDDKGKRFTVGDPAKGT